METNQFLPWFFLLLVLKIMDSNQCLGKQLTISKILQFNHKHMPIGHGKSHAEYETETIHTKTARVPSKIIDRNIFSDNFEKGFAREKAWKKKPTANRISDMRIAVILDCNYLKCLSILTKESFVLFGVIEFVTCVYRCCHFPLLANIIWKEYNLKLK